jgi:O-6-methylguanine DNA methyltransferase
MVQEVRAPHGFLEDVLRSVGLIDAYAYVASPIGGMYVASGQHGISAVMEAATGEEFERRYRARFGRRVERRDALAGVLKRAIDGGAGAVVDLATCTPFQRAVLDATRRIPAGTVRPYAWIAREIGHPGAVRAVGTALAKNPVPLVVPCHRVVRSDGEAGEYALGARDKIALLEHEGVNLPAMRQRVVRHRFWSAEGETSFCYPFCFRDDQVAGRQFREFRSVRDALAHGLEPCETCHPERAA